MPHRLFRRLKFFCMKDNHTKVTAKTRCFKTTKNYTFKIIKTKLNKTPEREYDAQNIGCSDALVSLHSFMVISKYRTTIFNKSLFISLPQFVAIP